MKRAMFSALAIVVLAALCGCRVHQQRPYACTGDGCAPVADGCTASCGQARDNGGDPNACNDPAQKHRCSLLCRERDCEPSAEQSDAAPGPPAAAVTYPYYTVRGPRDFLAKNPPSIGP